MKLKIAFFILASTFISTSAFAAKGDNAKWILQGGTASGSEVTCTYTKPNKPEKRALLLTTTATANSSATETCQSKYPSRTTGAFLRANNAVSRDLDED